MIKPEILAPGGSPESIYSAINAGCDAIYAGGRRFGARAFADNQDNDKLIDILNNIHLAGKRLYLTVNTVLTQSEIPQLYEYLLPLYENGLDAVIVQDLGALEFIHREFPDMPIHASTQMSITGSAAADLLMPYGVTRIVPARELSLAELASLRKMTCAELEVFVHGALCSSYSGQCLMSSLIGGRSGNRGACAQPCRKLYSLNDSEPYYPLSLKDLCTLGHIPSLVQCGIDSFKIEGRMKKPEYVAVTTHMYRKYLDIYMGKGEEFYRETIINSKEYSKDMKALLDIYNRGGFTSAYLMGNMDNTNMLSGKRPNHEGVIVGYVCEAGKGGAAVVYTDNVNRGDVLEIRDKSGAKVHDYTLGEEFGKGGRTRINAGYNNRLIKKGMQLFRVRNNMLIDSLLKEYPVSMGMIAVKGYISVIVGQPLTLKICNTDGNVTTTVYGNEVQKAERHAADESYIESKIMVTGDSRYSWQSLDVHIEGDAYIPPSELKNIRRRAFAAHEDNMLKQYRRSIAAPDNRHITYTYNAKDQDNCIIAECYNIRQLGHIISEPVVDELYIQYDAVREITDSKLMERLNKPYYIVLPRIVRSKENYRNIDKALRNIYSIDRNKGYRCFKGIVVCTLEQLKVFKTLCNELCMEMDSYDNLYVRNSYAAVWLYNEGISRTIASVEMTDAEMKEITSWDTSGSCIVTLYGKPSAMITAWTPGGSGELKDSYGNIYNVVEHDEYREIINYEPVDRIGQAVAYSGRVCRILFTDEDNGTMSAILDRLRRQM